MRGHQFTQERVEEAPQGAGTACAGLGSCLSVESLADVEPGLCMARGRRWRRLQRRGPRMPAEVFDCLVDGVMEGADTGIDRVRPL